MAASVASELDDELVKWRGQLDGLAAEADGHALADDLDVVDGQREDAADRLGEEQHEQSADATAQVERVVVQQPADRRHSLVVGLLVDVAAGLRLRQGERCYDAGAFGPDQEVADATGGVAGLLEPEVEVVLLQHGEREAALLRTLGPLIEAGHSAT